MMSDDQASKNEVNESLEFASDHPGEITPEEYSDFIGQIELLDIWLQEARIVNHRDAQTPDEAAVRFEVKAVYVQRDGSFQVTHEHRVTFETADSVLAEIVVAFGLEFSSLFPVNDQLFAIFEEVNLPVNTWPFLREFVATSLGRMGWSPFTIPALKTNVRPLEGSPKSGSKTK